MRSSAHSLPCGAEDVARTTAWFAAASRKFFVRNHGSPRSCSAPAALRRRTRHRHRWQQRWFVEFIFQLLGFTRHGPIFQLGNTQRSGSVQANRITASSCLIPGEESKEEIDWFHRACLVHDSLDKIGNSLSKK